MSASLSQSKGVKSSHVIAKEAFDWIQQTTELIIRLLEVLSETIEAWEAFRAPDGDNGYFSDMSRAPLRESVLRSFRSINQSFQALKYCQQRLVSLKESCQNSASAVSRNIIRASTNPRPANRSS
jgi:hypothetical protein